MLRSVALAIVLGLVLCGSLGAPFQRDVVPFNAIRSHDFTAIAVAHENGPPSSAPLVVRVRLLGDGADANLSAPFAWLRQNANVLVETGTRGAPLYLTRLDLSATSGRATLGATIDTGMAAEVDQPRVDDCVVAHELLHFLGLTHVSDPRNIMYPECKRDHLQSAILTSDQRAKLDAIETLVATTPSGVEVWATRA